MENKWQINHFRGVGGSGAMSTNSDLGEIKARFATGSSTREMSLSEVPSILQYLASVIMTGMATAVAAGFDRYETIPNLSLVYVLPVVASSVAFGLGPALFSALLGALAYNFFFTEPRFSLAVADTSNIWAIVLLFVVGCVVSTIASMKRHDAAELEGFHFRETALQIYARQMIVSSSVREATSLSSSVLTSLFQAPIAVIFVRDGDDLKIESETRLTLLEIEAARPAGTTKEVVTAGVYPFDKSRFDFWPTTTRFHGTIVVGAAFDPKRRPVNPEAAVAIVALTLCAAIDRDGM